MPRATIATPSTPPWVAGRFDSVTAVLLHDPVRIATTYLRDLYRLLSVEITRLVEPPLYFMFLPGVFLLLARRWSVGLAVVLAVTVAELLLTNLKQFQPRYYLFLVPLIGAAVGHMCWHVLRAAVGRAVADGFRASRRSDVRRRRRPRLRQDLRRRRARDRRARRAGAGDARADRGRRGRPRAQAAPRLPRRGEEHSSARSRHPGQLHDSCGRRRAQTPLYLLYGEIEQRLRPQFQALRTAAGAPDWLEVVAESAAPGQWILYRYRPAPID